MALSDGSPPSIVKSGQIEVDQASARLVGRLVVALGRETPQYERLPVPVRNHFKVAEIGLGQILVELGV